MKFQIVTASYVCLTSAILVLPAYADPLEDLETCKSIVAEAERLACFEAGYDQLRAAGMTDDSVLKSKVVEAEVPVAEETADDSRPRFKMPFFGNKKSRNDTDEVTDHILKPPSASHVERDSKGNVRSVESTVTSVHRNGLGYTTLTLANGQRWQTTQGRIRAAVGDNAKIKRTRLGGYFLTVRGKSGLRVKRLDGPSPTITAKSPDNISGTDGRKKTGGLLSRLNPFDNDRSESPVDETVMDDPNFGRQTRDLSSEETFGGVKTPKGERAAEQQTMKQTVSRVMVDPYDKFIITLENGQVWRQTDGRIKIRDGDMVTIRRAALGSFLLQVEGFNRTVRVKRVDG